MGQHPHRNQHTPDKIQAQAKSKSRFTFDAYEPLENQCATAKIFTLWDGCEKYYNLPNYQWQLNGTNIVGATNSTLTIANVQFANAGSYTVTLSSLGGTTVSSNAVLNIVGIASQPQSANLVQGLNAIFSVTAAELPGITGSFTYQWLSNGIAIAGATSSAYMILAVQTAFATNYSVIVSNSGVSLTSSNALLSVTLPLFITSEPGDQTVIQGTNASFTVGVSGNYLAYQWFANGVAFGNGSGITGATSATVTLSNVIASDAADYTVVVTNLFGSVTSTPATLTVITNPGIQTPPSSTNAIQADDVTFSVTATSVDLSYQWWFINGSGSNAIAAATNANYPLLVVQTNEAGTYTVVITNLAGSTNTDAVMNVWVPPWITNQPISITNNQGGNATFSVDVIGTSPISYQWLTSGSNAIAGATNSSLTLTNIQGSNVGTYSVLVSNVAGTNVSAWAYLSVILSGGGGTSNAWGSGPYPTNPMPTVAMIGPTNTYSTNPAIYINASTISPISIRASASSVGSYITNVAFYFTGSNYGTNFMLAGTAVPGADTMFALDWTNALWGTNIVKARAWDCNGNSNDSPLAYIIMAQPPTVVAGNTTNVWPYTNNINLSAIVSSDGQPNTHITDVLWSGIGISIANATTLTPTVTCPTSGVFLLQLQVGNGFATSTNTCTATIYQAPEISFAWPTNNEQYHQGTGIYLDVTALPHNVTGGISITKVEFFAGSSYITNGLQSINNTYTWGWYGAPLWTNVISAVAWDSTGLSSTTAVTVIVVPPLAVQFINPTNSELFILSPTNVLLEAMPTSYVGSSVTGVFFSNQFKYLGQGILTSDSVYSTLWQEVTNSSNYVLTVTATDNYGNVASNSLSITVNYMPVVSIVSPTNFQSYAETTNVTINATVNDTDGSITNIQFYKYFPFASNSLGDITNPTNVTNGVTWSNLTYGNYPVVAVATDNRGASTMSEITVFSITPTNPPPVVSIIYPTNASLFMPSVDITITAMAYRTNVNTNAVVTNVEFFVNATDIGGDSQGISNVYSITECCWKPGTYTLTAVATDNLGMSAIATNQITIAPDLPAAQGFWDEQFALTAYSLVWDWWALPIDQYTPFDLTYGSNGTLFAASTYAILASADESNWTTLWLQWSGTAPFWQGIMSDGGNLYGFASSDASIPTNVWLWNGTNWNQFGNGLNEDTPCTITAMANIGGNIYIAGDFTSDINGNTNLSAIARFDPTNEVWVPVGNGVGNGLIYAIAGMGNQIYIGGSFTNAGGNTNANYIACLQGNNWTNVGAGISSSDPDPQTDFLYVVKSLIACGTNLFVGGEFDMAGGQTNVPGIAIWNTLQWRTMDGGPGPATGGLPTADTAPFHVFTISPRGNRVFVGGDFTNVFNGTNAIPAQDIAMATWSEANQKWTWSDLDVGVAGNWGDPYDPSALLGYVWSSVLVNGTSADAYDLYVAGNFVVAGSQQIASGGIARWRVGYPIPPSVPSVSITNPYTPYVVTNPGSINLTGTANSKYTTIASVTLYTNGQVFGGATLSNLPGAVSSNFLYEWESPPNGLYLVTALTTDGDGLTGRSTPVVINIKSTTNPIAAVDDRYTIPVGTLSTNLQILSNDSPSNGLKISQLTLFHGDLGQVSLSFDRTYLIFTPFPGVYGTNIFFYTVTNSVGNSDSASVTLNLLAPPQVSITNFLTGYTQTFPVSGPPANVAGTALAVGSGNSVTNVSLFVYSTNTETTFTQIPSNGTFTFPWTNTEAGWYTFIAVATDINGSVGTSTPVTIVLSNSPYDVLTATINNLTSTQSSEDDFSTASDPVITNGIFDLHGQASDSISTDPVSYKVLLYQPDSGVATISDNVNDQADDYVTLPPFADITPGPTNDLGFHIGGDNEGDLGLINLTGVPNGVYEIVLQVRGGSAVSNTLVEVQLNSQLKIGEFTFGEQDMVLPVSGIPITITRTYNSMNPVSSDFGYNWTFAINSMNIQLDEQREDVPFGSTQAPNGPITSSGDGLPGTISVRTGGGRDVTVTLPNGQMVIFQCTYDALDDGIFVPGWKAEGVNNYILYDPNGDEYYALLGGVASGWNNTPGLAFDNFDIRSFVLSNSVTGIAYQITRGNETLIPFGATPTSVPNLAQVYGPPMLTEIDQPSGDKITISSNSIAHYAPGASSPSRAITISRDGAGRIIAIYDPNSTNTGLPALQYVYDQDTSNLIQVLKLVNTNTATYTTNFYDYNNPQFPHYITSIENGDGVTVTRNYYDSTGRLIEVEDANGNFTQFIHNITNNTEVVVDPLGNTNAYLYDGNGNVLAQTNALGQVTTMTYDGNNNKTRQVAYLGTQAYATTTWGYDTTLNLPTNSTDPLGNTTWFTYNNYGEMTGTTDPRRNTTTNVYDSYGNLFTTTDPLNNTTTSYYLHGTLVGSVDPLGTITTNTYDSNQNLTFTVTSASGVILSTNSFTYDLEGNRLTSTIWRHVGSSWASATTTNVYDAQNRVIQTFDSDGGTTSVVYDGAGRQIFTTDPLSHTTSYVYDYMGRLVETIYPDTTTESSTYDANGNRIQSVDRLGRTNTYTYDALNRLTITVYPDGTTNSTVYDGVGRVAQTIDALGNTNGFEYDLAGRRLAVTNAVGASMAVTNFYTYDSDGNQLTFTDGLGHSTTNVFDPLNRQGQTWFPDGTMISNVYDGDGRLVAKTNQDSYPTLFGYDGAGRLTSVTDALNQVTRYQYDEAGNETSQIDALNRMNVYVYDGMGRRVQHFMPGLQWEGYSNDVAGNLIYQTNFNNAVITNQYDKMNRLTSRTSVGGYNVSFTYTLTGQRASMTDPSGMYSYLYDSRDRLTNKIVSWLGCPPIIISNTYDANGNVTTIHSSTSNGVNLAYSYDALNHLTCVLANGGNSAVNSFDLAGNLVAMQYGNGVTNRYQYDLLNRLTNLTCLNVSGVIASNYYQLDLTGNRTNMNELVGTSSRTYAWQYDHLYRLTNESITTFGGVVYGLDPVGNRLGRSGTSPQTLAYNTNDWLTNDTYDSNGNTTASSGNAYNYDALNHLTNANVNGVSILMTYDGDGNRVSKTVGGTTNYYMLDESNPSGYVQVLEEYQGTNLSRVYNYGLALISQRQISNGAVSYYGYDGHGSTRFLLNSSGAIANTYTYDAYGTFLASTVSVSNNYLYCGQQYDPDLGLYYNRARYLNPNTGRFWTMDTYDGDQQDPLSLHKYLYCEADPVNESDSSGNDDDPDSWSSAVDSVAFSMAQRVADVGSTGGKAGTDVTDRLNNTLTDIATKFNKYLGDPNWDPKRMNMIRTMSGMKGRSAAEDAWDIIELGYPSLMAEEHKPYTPPGLNYGSPPLFPTVGFKGKSYFARGVNYAMWGKMWKLAATFTHDDKTYSLENALAFVDVREQFKFNEGPGNINYEEKLAFTKYGYVGTDPGNSAISGAVPQASTGTTIFNWCWEPGVPRRGSYPGMSQ